MPAGQVSVWVPIAVAVLGILGVLAGQFLSFRREDRRWQREVEREELRWNRDQERDVEAHWRDERFEAYVRLTQVLGRWEPLLYEEVENMLRGNPVSEENLEAMSPMEREADEVMARVSLLGSSKVYNTCMEVVDFYRFTMYELRARKLVPGNQHPQDVVVDSYHEVVDTVRGDLGLGPRHGKAPASEPRLTPQSSS
ncbi:MULTISPECIES: hypothetical protein [unclassified Nonomuraea]|uniref:hypothetical protein n=1 Tax=unclassified Nonomuraea TaxID=2593643 RepID=UPI0033D21514